MHLYFIIYHTGPLTLFRKRIKFFFYKEEFCYYYYCEALRGIYDTLIRY